MGKIRKIFNKMDLKIINLLIQPILFNYDKNN